MYLCIMKEIDYNKIYNLCEKFWKHELRNEIYASFQTLYDIVSYIEQCLGEKKLMFNDPDGEYNEVCHDFVYEDLLTTLDKLKNKDKNIVFDDNTKREIREFVGWIIYCHDEFINHGVDTKFKIIGRTLTIVE